MVHRRECLCSASQLWLPHPALCVVPPECFRGLRIWSGAVGSKSGKLRNVVDRDTQKGNSAGGCDVVARAQRAEERPWGGARESQSTENSQRSDWKREMLVWKKMKKAGD